MDTTFWMGIIIGAVISLFTSFAANLYTDQIRQYLHKQRSIRLNKKKENELKTYRLVKGIREGDSLAILRLNRMRDFSLRTLIFAAMMTVFLAASPNLPSGKVRAVFSIAVVLFAISSIALSYAAQVSVERTINKAEKLEEYVASIRTKWGSDAV